MPGEKLQMPGEAQNIFETKFAYIVLNETHCWIPDLTSPHILRNPISPREHKWDSYPRTPRPSQHVPTVYPIRKTAPPTNNGLTIDLIGKKYIHSHCV